METRATILLSVIVPVYNAESFLPKCIESILNQSYSDFELILINDGASDKSGEICDKYAETDARVKVFHRENQGVSSARNEGIVHSRGEYITFCDADDWFDEDYLLMLMRHDAVDLVIGSYTNFVKGKSEKIIFADSLKANVEEIGVFLQENLSLFSVYFSAPWGKRYKKEIINRYQIYFDTKVSSGEDALWVFEYYRRIKTLKVISSNGYYYRQYYSKTQLSAKPLTKRTIDYTLNNLHDKLDLLEHTFKVDFTAYRYNTLLTFFLKYINHLSSGNVLQVRSKLNEISTDAMFTKLWRDKVHILKGKRRKLFDKLMLSRRFLVLAIHLKLVKKVY